MPAIKPARRAMSTTDRPQSPPLASWKISRRFGKFSTIGFLLTVPSDQDSLIIPPFARYRESALNVSRHGTGSKQDQRRRPFGRMPDDGPDAPLRSEQKRVEIRATTFLRSIGRASCRERDGK